MRVVAVAALFLIAVCTGCGGGEAAGPVLQAAPLVVAAGPTQLAPAATDTVSPGTDLGRLDVTEVAEVYEVTTPAGEPFVFDVLSRAEGNTGDVRVSLAHAADGGAVPVGGAESLAMAGVVPSATGATSRAEWLDVHGDGFARVTVRGVIEREQVIAVETESEVGIRTALIKVAIGPRSVVNPDPGAGSGYDGVLEETTIYSSDSWSFGLPTLAVSGDRASVVAYEGDQADPHGIARYEMRLQYDLVTGVVTGGGTEETSRDSGHWRDHEIAALYNVLALVRCGGEDVIAKLSFDRGASFGQVETLATGNDGYSPRLCQIAMADDYTTAIAFWRASRSGESELLLVEGRPSAFDGTGSPTRFAFDPPRVLRAFPGDVSPVLMGMQFSEGGDLVLGYGFTSWETLPDGSWRTTTQFSCAVRPFGGTVRDVVVEETVLVGRDPSVALVGSGDTMRIFFAYEGREGVRLRVSDDAGRTWSAPESAGRPGAYMPTVFAQPAGEDMRVDVLYLAESGAGPELWLRHWDNFGVTAPEDHRLTESVLVETSEAGGGRTPGAMPGIVPPEYGYRITQIGWFGYDAVRDGDEIVVVYDEQTHDGMIFFDAPVALGVPLPAGPLDGASGDFIPATPPPLQEGMTGAVETPDPDDMHQLVVMRLG